VGKKEAGSGGNLKDDRVTDGTESRVHGLDGEATGHARDVRGEDEVPVGIGGEDSGEIGEIHVDGDAGATVLLGVAPDTVMVMTPGQVPLMVRSRVFSYQVRKA
jgi:hypothetical protein